MKRFFVIFFLLAFCSSAYAVDGWDQETWYYDTGEYHTTSVDPLTPGTLVKGLDEDSIESTGISVSASDDVSDVNSLTLTNGQPITWNIDENTINIPSGYGSSVQVGQEIVIKVYNNSGSLIPNGTVVAPAGYFGDYSTIILADSSTHEDVLFDYGLTTTDIADGAYGMVCWFGKARNIDTSAFAQDDVLYVSPTTPGAVTNVRPKFPDYVMPIGIVDKVSATEGIIFVTGKETPKFTVLEAFNGVFRESFSFTIASDGATITGSLVNKDATRDLTMVFSEGFSMLDVTPAATVVLTPGTDSNPQANYIYIPASTKVLTSSISGWPTGEHIKVATTFVQSAARVQTNDALRNQNWNDHFSGTDGMGHIAHVSERVRQLNAQWSSGTEATITDNANVVTIAVSAGKVYQMHIQDYSAYDTAAGDHFHVVNDFSSPYVQYSDMNLIPTDADGDALTNGSFSFVIWGVCNSGSEPDQLMLNVPVDGYSRLNPEDAVRDPENYAVYTIPDAFKGVGFLIARVIVQIDALGTGWDIYQVEDLRGKVPNITAGGGAGGGTGVTTFAGLVDTPSSYVSQGNKYVRVAPGETALEFSNISASETSFTPYGDIASSNVQTAIQELDDEKVTAFTGLSDTPSTFSGQSGRTVKVNTGETALEFLEEHDRHHVNGLGYFFDGTNDYIASSKTGDDPIGTMEIVFRPLDTNDCTIYGAVDGSSNKKYISVKNGKIGGGIGSQNDTTIIGTTDIVAGETYHIGLMWDGTTVQLYVNGVEEYNAAQSGTTPSIVPYIGALNNNGSPANYMHGEIYLARMYNLTFEETSAYSLEGTTAGTDYMAIDEMSRIPFIRDLYKWGDSTQQTSGALANATWYRLEYLAPGDVFTNCSPDLDASGKTWYNNSGGSCTPTTWTNGSIVKVIGCTLDYSNTWQGTPNASADIWTDGSDTGADATVTGPLLTGVDYRIPHKHRYEEIFFDTINYSFLDLEGQMKLAGTYPDWPLPTYQVDAVEALVIGDVNSTLSINDSAPELLITDDRDQTAPDWNADTVGSIQFVSEDPDGAGTVGEIRSVVTTDGLNYPQAGMSFHTGSSVSLSEKMRIEDGGNVGINVTDPAYRLNVNSGTEDDVAVFESTDANSYIGFKDNTTTTVQKIGAVGDALSLNPYETNSPVVVGYPIDVTDSDFKVVKYSANSRPNIKASSLFSSNSWIEIESPSLLGNFNAAYLHIDAGGNQWVAGVEDSTEPFGGDFRIIPSSSISDTPAMTIQPGGNVGIGTDQPSEPLEVRGSDVENIRVSRDASNFGSIGCDATGGIYLRSGSGNIVGSDGSHDYQFTLYDASNNQDVMIRTNGDSWFNGGDVGIGFDSPERLLHVRGNNATFRIDRDQYPAAIQMHAYPTGDYTTPYKGFLLMTTGTGTGAGYFSINDYGTAVGGSSTERFKIHDGGLTEVIGPGSNSELMRIGPSGYTERALSITNFAVDGYNLVGYDFNAPGAGGTRGTLSFSTLGNEVMRVSYDGKVGIGTTSPVSKLSIGDTGTNYALDIAGNASSRGYVGQVGSTLGLSVNRNILTGAIDDTGKTASEVGLISANGSGAIYFRTGDTNNSLGSEKMRIQGDGDVGIGVSNPIYKLEVYDASDTYQLRLESGTTAVGLRLTDPSATSSIYHSGSVVGINPTGGSTAYQFSQSRFSPTTNNTVDLGASGTTFKDVYGVNAYTQTSDADQKQNISPIPAATLQAFFYALEPVSYGWKPETIPAWTEEKEVQATETVIEEQTRIVREQVDGQWRQYEVTEQVEVEKPLYTDEPVFDQDGEPILIEVTAAEYDDEGQVITPAVLEQKTIQIPVMTTETIEHPEVVKQTDTNTHFGLTAQGIESALIAAGVDPKKSGLLVYNEDGSKPIAVRYAELIGPTIAAIKLLDKQHQNDVNALNAEITDLKNSLANAQTAFLNLKSDVDTLKAQVAILQTHH